MSSLALRARACFALNGVVHRRADARSRGEAHAIAAVRSRVFPFDASLRESAQRDFLAYVLVNAPDRPLRCASTFARLLRRRHPGYDTGRYGYGFQGEAMPWLMLPDGALVPDNSLVHWTGIDRILVIVRHYRARVVPGFDHTLSGAVFGLETPENSRLEDRAWPAHCRRSGAHRALGCTRAPTVVGRGGGSDS